MTNKKHTQNTTLQPNIQPHQEITLAIKQQEHIGWDHFVRGRLSKLWKVAQKTYQGQKYTSKWPLLCIKAITNTTLKIWEIRNIMKFGTDSQVMTNHQKRLKPKIMAYYDTYHQTIPRTQHKLFQVPLQIRLTFSPKENTQWIKTVKLAKKIHKLQEKEFYKSFYPITRYFPAIQNRQNTSSNPQQKLKPKEINTSNNPRKSYKQTKILHYITRQPLPAPTDAPT